MGMYGMEPSTKNELRAPCQDLLFWISGYGGRNLTIFDMEPEEVEKVVTLFGGKTYFKETENGMLEKKGTVTIGPLEISLHSKEYVPKEQGSAH